MTAAATEVEFAREAAGVSEELGGTGRVTMILNILLVSVVDGRGGHLALTLTEYAVKIALAGLVVETSRVLIA